MKSVEIIISDPDNNIENLLKLIESATQVGHNLHISVDRGQGGEFEKDFFIDGDGNDSIIDLEIVEVPKRKNEPEDV